MLLRNPKLRRCQFPVSFNNSSNGKLRYHAYAPCPKVGYFMAVIVGRDRDRSFVKLRCDYLHFDR